MNKSIDYKNNFGVSPVIGVILFVAITVGLVALSVSIYFDIASDFVNKSPDASFQLSQDTNSNTVQAQVIRNNNVDYFIFEPPEGSLYTDTKTIGSDNGQTGEIGRAQYTDTDIDNNKGEYILIAVMTTGDQEVVDTITVD